MLSEEILKRRTLSIAEREELVTMDAIEVAEYTLSLAKFKLEKMIRSIGTSDEFYTQINMDKLAKILQTALPYVIAKPDAKEKKKKNHKNHLCIFIEP